MLFKRRRTAETMQSSEVVLRGPSLSTVGSSSRIASFRTNRLTYRTCRSSKRCILMPLWCLLSQNYHSRLKIPKRGREASLRGTRTILSSGMTMQTISTVLWSLSPQCLKYLMLETLVREGESKETKRSG